MAGTEKLRLIRHIYDKVYRNMTKDDFRPIPANHDGHSATATAREKEQPA
jgi:hypothetical protein